MTPPRVLIAGGGTGGHVFPGVAVAEAMLALADVEPIFCGTARGVEARVIPARGWRLELLEVEPIKGGGPLRALCGALVAARATAKAVALVRRLAPRAILGVGGYAAGPVALAGALCGVPLTLLEPNRVPGLSNRLVAPLARRAYLAWPETGAAFRFAARRVTGVPLRAGFEPRPYTPRQGSRVLVLGGSQGAAALNDRMPEAVGRLRHLPGLQVLHQAGNGRDADVRVAYAREGVAAAVVVPFLDDVVGALAEADLVVARSGASSIAELAAIGRASILVPFPDAADDHQGRNAEALAAVGAAVCLRQQAATATQLCVELERLLRDDGARVAMARAAMARGRPGAATDLAVDLLDLAGVEPRRRGANGRGRDTPAAREAR